uniref:Golgin candidate 5 n=1 Tax=Kalanchoe fedtschenkoi TaxID=63787 RepID=A0A7N0RIS6_KALFE
MAWFSGKVSLGNFPDLAGAVNKLSESVKNIEKNFDSALGFEEKADSESGEASSLWPLASDRKALFDPVMAFMGHKDEESNAKDEERHAKDDERSVESPKITENLELSSKKNSKEVVEKSLHDEDAVKADMASSPSSATAEASLVQDHKEVNREADDGESEGEKKRNVVESSPHKETPNENFGLVDPPEPTGKGIETHASFNQLNEKEISHEPTGDTLQHVVDKSETAPVEKLGDFTLVPAETQNDAEVRDSSRDPLENEHSISVSDSPAHRESSVSSEIAAESNSTISSVAKDEDNGDGGEQSENNSPEVPKSGKDMDTVHDITSQNSEGVPILDAIQQSIEHVSNIEKHVKTTTNVSSAAEAAELDKLRKEMKLMESALQGAAKQAQAKADEIAKLMNENEQLKSIIDELRSKSNESEKIESLREEYHQRVATLERKVYALTKERDTLRREQNKKSDAAALLKEKDEIITQVMAEGEELSKKQAVQEAQIRKLRAQIRELEEDKKGLTSKLQVEESKVESIKRDKAATEALLQETIEKHQAELATQKEYYANALAAAKEAEALAEARANNEARTELESRLKEAQERENMLVQTLEELRQTLSRQEQQAVFREDMLRQDIEDLQKRYQASERRCEELISQVPESTRPLLRQIEAMQETISRRAEAWSAVERSLNSRLQEAETKAATAEERERSINERLSQTLSRVNVLEAQISCLRAEQTQLTRSLEKERQRAAESRQEYLAAKEDAETQNGRAKQLEEEIRELRRKHKQDLQEALTQRELLQQVDLTLQY